jgi:acyl dehydratase
MIREGDTFTQTFVITEEIHAAFIRHFKDANPLHVDAEYARRAGFRDRVMHGNILNGFVSYFVGEGLPVRDVVIHSQSIDYKKPVYQGEVLRFSATATNVSDAVGAIEFKFTFAGEAADVRAKGKIQIGLLR